MRGENYSSDQENPKTVPAPAVSGEQGTDGTEAQNRLEVVRHQLYDKLETLRSQLDSTPTKFFTLALSARELPSVEVAEAAFEAAHQLGYFEGLQEAFNLIDKKDY